MTRPSHYCFVPWHGVPEYLRLGWVPTDALAGTHHEEWSVALAWLCECPPREPPREPR